ncbi:energy-coupling factor transport system permease protein [Quadrisphaera granulorum]|uniref:Energy-coupling factor transport system permease protein n=1 Tax=Quadrisphaera granulorum TaxID=317664 RepID=A0A316AE06_9ACTN|nr:energy-coupling factor transporter transmembrane component T [Quadrisphaera granulorum]PWJ55851.1 energy-coupling factor transport system permease protein [Quadrisphaera granulorum]SZE95348.1 energy-coupling factor transport system permease protein [Quadrisphaera granulorum]
MSTGLLDPGVVRPTALARANPVAKLAVALVLAFGLLLSVDIVTAGTAVVLELALLPLAGLGALAVLRRSAVLLLAAVPVAVVSALLGVDSGAVLVDLGPISVTSGSLQTGGAIGLRVVAIALPGVVLLATTDPTDLADALAQVLHLPARFVLGALAAFRVVDVLLDEWRQLGLARRARGLGGDGLLASARDVAGRAFVLLVIAVRRAAVLATAMEARGFGAGEHQGADRTWARPSRLRPGDVVVVLVGVAVTVVSTAAGVAAGTWELVIT